jgi:hypothetical protein
MRSRLAAALVIVAAIMCGPGIQTAGATPVTFDDIFGGIPAGYAGFNWGGWQVIPDWMFAEYGNTYDSPSGTGAANNAGGGLVKTISADTDFDFIGAYFTGWALNDSYGPFTATSITVEGYNNGTLVNSATMLLSANGYDWFAANLLGVDQLRFISSGDGQDFLMDDFTFNETVAAPVPEPTSLLLVGSGLAVAARRFRKRSA